MVIAFVLGVVAGVVAALVVAALRRPYVKRFSFERRDDVSFGPRGNFDLIDLRFELAGGDNPGFCALAIRWTVDAERGGTFAKWDELPEPARPGEVASTFFQPLYYKDDPYRVPILAIETDTKGALPEIFCGWWYLNRNDYVISNDAALTLTLLGGGALQWEQEFSVAELLACVPAGEIGRLRSWRAVARRWLARG